MVREEKMEKREKWSGSGGEENGWRKEKKNTANALNGICIDRVQ